MNRERTSADEAATDWKSWARGWEARMAAHFPRREEMLATSLDLVNLFAPEPTYILDLGSGPGSLAARVLNRFPSARVVALDFDPVLLAIGRGALGDAAGRLTWINGNLAIDGWADLLDGHGPFDAVVSIATLHHLSGPRVREIYQALNQLIRPDGIVVNAEFMAVGRPQTRLTRALKDARARFAEGPETWWPSVSADPTLGPLYLERNSLLEKFPSRVRYASAEAHTRALLSAGFSEASVAWQHFDETIVVAVR